MASFGVELMTPRHQPTVWRVPCSTPPGAHITKVRQLAQWALQELIEAEAAAVIGAGPWERGPERTTHRNGHRPRLLSTATGDLHLEIPKLRQGTYFPSLLEPRRRIDQALHAVVMEAYVHGVSTRAVDDLVEAMGVTRGMSKSEVSRICAGLDELVDAFRNRTLGHVAFPYVYLDATYVNVRDEALGQVVSRAVVIATGITANGRWRVVPRFEMPEPTVADLDQTGVAVKPMHPTSPGHRHGHQRHLRHRVFSR